LSGVSDASATSALAVGSTSAGCAEGSSGLVLKWNGSAWSTLHLATPASLRGGTARFRPADQPDC
jgi:hypothetical protein